MSQIPLDTILLEKQQQLQVGNRPLLKPLPRDVSQETAAFKNYQKQNKKQIENAKVSSTKSLEKHANRIHCKTNYLNSKTLLNPEILHSEHQKAAKLAHVGDFIKNTPGLSNYLQYNNDIICFSHYIPGKLYTNNIIITNPCKTSRRFIILPPKQPFHIQHLAGNLAPGASQELIVSFLPVSHGIFSSEVEIRSGEQTSIIALQARNLPGVLSIEKVLLDERAIPCEMSCRREQNRSVFDVKIQQINKSYDEPHNCRILLKNAQNDPKGSVLRVASVDISAFESDPQIELFVSSEASLNCDFRQKYEEPQAPENAFQASKLQQFLAYEKRFFGDYFEFQKPETPVLEQHDITMLGNSILALELDFQDNLTKPHQISIKTLENYEILINFSAKIANSAIQISKIDENPVDFTAEIDLKSSDFLEIYAKKRLPKSRILNISSEIDSKKVVLRRINFEFEGVESQNVSYQMRYFETNLALGYLNNIYTHFESENFAFSTENDQKTLNLIFKFALPEIENLNSQQHNISEFLHKQKIPPPRPKKAILDVNFKNFTIFRILLNSIPIFHSISDTLLKEHKLSISAAINYLQTQQIPLTDYLLISEPALDLSVIPLQSGAEFKFRVRNCSQNCFIPFIVSTNLRCSSSKLVTIPHDSGVHFRWSKQHEIVNSDVSFPDVCDVFNGQNARGIYENLDREIPVNYQPQYLKQVQISSRKSGKIQRNQAVYDEPEPIMAFPHAGIIPPQCDITIHIKVRPLSLGPIEAFIVINTPGTLYYEQVLKQIHVKVKAHENQEIEINARKSSSMSVRSVLSPLKSVRPSTSLKQFQQVSANPFLNFQDSSLNYKNSSLKLFEQLRDKAIPLSEMQRLFTPFQPQVFMEGGFLSERDVCCRVYGTVAAPEVEFGTDVYAPENDQLKPVELILINKGKTSVSVDLTVLSGDASFLNIDEIPSQLAPAGLSVWFRQRKQQIDQVVELELDQSKPILMLPGLQDSTIVCKKNIQAFGVMASQLPQNLIDSDNNVIISATTLKKRLEPLKPYVYLDIYKQSFDILNPTNPAIQDFAIQTRPYHPITIPFTIVNPSSSIFVCEIAIGQDLIAPQIIKIRAQSKANAFFAINPDRSGDIESFIQFHDASMRIHVSSFGPDVSIRCPFVQNFDNLHEKQGMIRQNDKNEAVQGQSWERLLCEIPLQIEILDLEICDFQVKQPQKTTQRMLKKASNQNAILDLTQLKTPSTYDEILQEMPFLILQNQGSTQSKSINISIHNPTGSSMLLKPKISQLNKNFLKLQIHYNSSQNQIQLFPGGLFSSNQLLDTPFFVCSPSETEILSMKSQQIAIKATNMKKFGVYEGILQLNGIFLRLKCEREPPKIKFCDGAKSLEFQSNFSSNYLQNLNIVSQCQSQLEIEIEIDFPLQISEKCLKIDALSRVEFALKLTKSDVFQFFNIVNNSENDIQNLILSEIGQRQIQSKIVLKIQNSDQIPYELTYPIQAVIAAPELYPRRQILQFKNTFPRREDLRFFKLENASVLAAKFEILHVKISEFLGLQNENLEKFGVEKLIEIQFNKQQQMARKVTESCQKSFSDFQDVYFDESEGVVVLDVPAHFEFSFLEGEIGGHQNQKPHKNCEIGVRFSPQDESFDMTRDRVFRCQYRSVFYVKVNGGTGCWIGCVGSVNTNIDEV
ncbi:hypothetical protein SS50377_26309 [Spironucleus salmonicida]|uniref:Uncharacterized protein n=1 Tax=Spironucleus salmonicida TaxID=348837 RepID=V6LTB9_9EUKA|nr:hypothetical protein SS50377_26309 [Spironucleus salmonicida]|eukprot:EST47825.1 hypothetical protein SS50377_12226 [Spironucleus salmonicida]